MIDLLLSIILTTYLVLCFRYYERFRISNFHAIVFNYWTCVATGMLVAPQGRPEEVWLHQAWFPIAAVLGLLFFVIFNIMGYVARHISTTLTSLASKLSLVIPVSIAMIFFGEGINALKAISLLLAVIAVVLYSWDTEAAGSFSWTHAIFPALVIFLGSGANDTLVNYAVQRCLTSDELHDFSIAVFLSASVWGAVALLAHMLWRRRLPPGRSLLAGLLLGVPNYFSLYFLTRALGGPMLPSSSVIIINNVGIVVLTALAAAILFRERFGRIKQMGMFAALMAMVLLYVAKQ
ncbi:MAG: hypothetical protein NZL95_06820 [Chitinophagales bacterium]|nr:hypothetical protein [Chitinophagales bacterium]MDW8428250.1 hypothetical protein [Chitinophagales bacterium]